MKADYRFTLKVLIGMGCGIALGLSLKLFPASSWVLNILIDGVAVTLGTVFIHLLKMLVVPIVFISIVCGVGYLGEVSQLGGLAVKSIGLYLITTANAIILALFIASLFHVGAGMSLQGVASFTRPTPVSFSQVIINIFPTNPIKALSDGNMLQIIIFALFLGVAIVAGGDKTKGVLKGFNALNEVVMKLVLLVMSWAPLGVFFLLLGLFYQLNIGDIGRLVYYFFTVVFVLVIQVFVVYGGLLWCMSRQAIGDFLKKIYPAIIFAFSTSSSSATIPITLKAVRERLGVNEAVSAFVIPLGATINMDGTAIMQGVATVFIANAYHIVMGIGGYVTVILMATLASIGTAGVPGVGLLTLVMVLEQVGLPVSGIALILGVDRLLDMLRTAVNVTGDSMVARVLDDRQQKVVS